MRNSTKMGGSIKYQVGGPKKPMMKPTKIQVGKTKLMTPAEKAKAFDKFKKDMEKQVGKSKFSMPKKKMGGPMKPQPGMPVKTKAQKASQQAQTVYTPKPKATRKLDRSYTNPAIIAAKERARIQETFLEKPKKQMGGIIPAKPIATAPMQGTMGRRGAAGSNMAKGGQKFPDLTGDGRVTKKDILKGRGVYGNKKKKYANGGGPGDGDPVVPPVVPPVPPEVPKAAASPGFYDLAMQVAQTKPKAAMRQARRYEKNNNQTNEDIKVAEATKTRKGSAFGAGATGLGAAFSGIGNLINAFKPTPSINVTPPPAGGMKRGGQKHPGFKAVQSKIAAKSGVSKKAAGAILAASTRKASAKAKAANPRLKKVK